MTLCPDCQRAERELWPMYSTRLCCKARSVAETVGRSGKGYTVEDVREKLLERFTAGLEPQDAQAVRERAYAILASRKVAA